MKFKSLLRIREMKKERFGKVTGLLGLKKAWKKLRIAKRGHPGC